MATIGRPPAMDHERKKYALRLAAQGYDRKRIAGWLGISDRTLRRAVAADEQFAGQLNDTIGVARRRNRKPGVASMLRQLAAMIREQIEAEESESQS